MILNGVYDKYFGYSFEMFWRIELKCRRNNHNQYQLRYNAIKKKKIL